MTSNAPCENGTSRVRVNTKTQSCESLIAIIQKWFDATNVSVKHHEALANFIAKVRSDKAMYTECQTYLTSIEQNLQSTVAIILLRSL